MNQPRKQLNNIGFFKLLARKGLEKAHVSEHLDPEVREQLEHIKEATLEKLSDDSDSYSAPPELGDAEAINVEGTEL